MSRPTVESIETRRHFSVAVANNVLYVTGTAGNDTVVITQGKDNRVTVSDNGKVTTLAPYAVSAIGVDTGAGNDTVALNNLVLPTGGSVITGDGRDAVLINGGNVNGDFLVDTGADADLVTFTNSTIEGGVFTTGDGNDTVLAYGNTFWNYGTLQTGAGNDTVILAKTVAFGYTTIDTGDGFDTFVGVKNNFAGGFNINAELKLIV